MNVGVKGMAKSNSPISALSLLDDLDFDEVDTVPSVLDVEEDPDLEAKIFENEEVKQRILKGTDIRDYQKEIEEELTAIERDSVLQYLSERENFATLYEEMTAVESALETIESVLNEFHEQLGTITEQIRSMQIEAKDQEKKLENRRARNITVKQLLSSFINDVNLPDNLIQALKKGAIDETFIGYLKEFNSKLTSLKQYEASNVQAINDVSRTIKQLIKITSSRVSEWLQQRINYASSNLETLLIVQKQLLNYKELFAFLHAHTPNLANNITASYVHTASTHYFNFYKARFDEFSRLLLETANKHDVIGEPESTSQGLFKSLQRKKQKQNVFSLETRLVTLEKLDEPLEFPTKASSDQKFSYEYLFRSVLHQFAVHVTAEMSFCKEFMALDQTDKVFGRTSALLLSNYQNFIRESHDCIGMLILLIIVWRVRSLMNQWQETGLNTLFEQLVLQTIPRVVEILEEHTESVRAGTLQTLKGVDQRPHYTTRRYAEFVAAIGSLAKDYPDAISTVVFQRQLVSLRVEMDKLIKRLADHFTNPTDQLVFLINNYDLIRSIAKERNVQTDDTAYFSKERTRNINKLGTLLLTEKFNNLMRFMQLYTKRDGDNIYLVASVQSDIVSATVLVFSANWKQNIKSLFQSVLSTFPNFDNGRAVLKYTLSELLVYYKGFVEILRQHFPDSFNSQQLVAVTALQAEIRQYLADVNIT